MARMRTVVDSGRPIIGAGAGTGISAKFAEKGGTDLILIYNSGRYRMNGFGSNAGLLAIGDANQIVTEMGERDVLPVVKDTPVIAGVNGTDPTRVMPLFLNGLPAIGFSGVINFPSHGIIDGAWRQSLEETGFGYDREVAMIAEASRQGIFTLCYSFTPDEACAMVDAGVDIVVAHMGLTTGGSIGATGGYVKTVEDCIGMTRDIADAVRAKRKDIIVLGHGGPVEDAASAKTLVQGAGIEGFVGASTMERLPVETALEETVRSFKDMDMGPSHDAHRRRRHL